MFSQRFTLILVALSLSLAAQSAPLPGEVGLAIRGPLVNGNKFHDFSKRLSLKLPPKVSIPKVKPSPVATPKAATPPPVATTKAATPPPVATTKAASPPPVATTKAVSSPPAVTSKAITSATSTLSAKSSAAVSSSSAAVTSLAEPSNIASTTTSTAITSKLNSTASTTASSSAAASSAAASCAVVPAAKRGPFARAVRSLLGRKDDEHTFGRRAITEAETGQSITINGFTATLGTQFSGANAGSGSTATFDVTWRGGVAAVAKQQTTISSAAFATEVANTKAAGAAQGNGLFIENGCFNGAQWMIQTKLTGQDMLTLFLSQKPPLATCQANIASGSNLAAAAQANLAAKAGFVQGDDNQENYLFDPQFTHVDIIDFGQVNQVPAAGAAGVQASQLKNFQQEVFGPLLEIAQANGVCK